MDWNMMMVEKTNFFPLQKKYVEKDTLFDHA